MKLSVQSSVGVTGVTVHMLMSLLERLLLCLIWSSISGAEYTAYDKKQNIHKMCGVNKSLWSVSSRKLLRILLVKAFFYILRSIKVQICFGPNIQGPRKKFLEFQV